MTELEKEIQELRRENEKLRKERDAAILDKKRLERAVGKAIPKTCNSCQLWGTNGWSQYQVGYCEGDENPHSANDFCSRWRGVQEGGR